MPEASKSQKPWLGQNDTGDSLPIEVVTRHA